MKLDDAGLYLLNQSKVSGSKFKQIIGRGLLAAAPRLMAFLAFAGTVAMFLVGGGILVHGVSLFHHWQVAVTEFALVNLGSIGEGIAPLVFDGVFGVLAGALVVLIHHAVVAIMAKKPVP